MKKAFIILSLIIASVSAFSQTNVLRYYLTAAQMKRVIPVHQQPAILYGRDSINDFKGGSFLYDSLYTGVIDNITTFRPDSLKLPTGAWVKRITSQQTVGTGMLYINGSSRAYTLTGITSVGGQITLIVTTTGTTAGLPLFDKITTADISPVPGGLTGYWGYLYSVSADMKTIVVQMQSISLGAIVAAVTGQTFNITVSGFKN